MRRKGFTLIELLAVIVVLAVIAMITTPIVFGVINTAKKGAAEQSTVAYVKAIESTVTIDDFYNKSYANRDDYLYDEIKADVSGSTPTGGVYALKDGIVTRGTFCVNGYKVTYSDSKAKAYEKCTGDDLKWDGSLKLEQTSGFYAYPESKQINIVENTSGGKISCTSSDEKVATCSVTGTTIKIASGTKEGVSTITVKSEGNSKYKDAYVAYVATTQKGLISYTSNGYEGVYDGNLHGITVIANGFKVKYGEIEGTYNLDESPKYVDAGEYKVYYQISKDGYAEVKGSKDVIISQAKGNIVLEETKGNLEYNKIKKVQIKENKANNSLIVSVEDENIAQARIENNELIITGKKVGTTKITLSSSATTNYSSASTEYIVTIIKASNKIVLSSTNGTYTYPNSGTFNIASNPSGGKLSCTTSNKNVAECTISGNTVTVKPGTTKGSATLTITSEATTNYNAGKAVYAVTTEQGKLSYTANGYEGTYNGNPHGITVTSSGATITYSTDGKNYSSTSPKYTNAGIYTVYYKIEKSGYNTITGNKQVIIIPSAPTITASDSIGSGSWHASKYTLTFSSSGASSSVYYYYGTSSNPSTKGSSAAISSDTGGTTYYVKACVSDSKCSAVSSYSAKLDSTKPNKPSFEIKLGSRTGSNYTSNSWTNNNGYFIVKSSDSTSGIDYYEVSLNGSDWTKHNAWNYEISKDHKTVYSMINWDGNWTFKFRAVDYAGNRSDESATIRFKRDTTSPSFGTVSLNPNLTSWANRCGKKINVSWNLTDSGSGVKMQNGHPYLMRAYYSTKSRNTLLSPVYGYDSDATTKGNIYGGGGILKVCAYDYAGNSKCFEKTLMQYCSSEAPWSLSYVTA